jgi:hypothetical protein
LRFSDVEDGETALQLREHDRKPSSGEGGQISPPLCTYLPSKRYVPVTPVD